MKLSTAIAFFFAAGTAQAEWKTETDLGLVSQSGNTNQKNALLKTKWTKESGKSAYTLHGEYINSAGETTDTSGNKSDARLAESANAGLKYTRAVSEKFGVFAAALWEKNRFAGFEHRYSADLGLKYNILKNEAMYFFNETGYRYRSQFEYLEGTGKGPETESHFARIYFEYGKKLNKTSNFRLWVENLVDFKESDNYEINFEPSIDVELGEFFTSGDKATRLSLKVAYKGMYDKVPAAAGLKKYDSILSTGIKVLY